MENINQLEKHLKIYVKRYENHLRSNQIEENVIRDLSDSWVASTLRYYCSTENSVILAINLFELLNAMGPEVQDEICEAIQKVK